MIGVLLTIALFLFLINARPAYAFATLVQQNNFGCACNGSGIAHVSLFLSGTVTAGDVLVVGLAFSHLGSPFLIVCGSPIMTVVCVADAHGSQFTQAAATGATGSSAVLIYAATIPPCGNCIPSDEFTVTFLRGTFMDVYAYEVSGVSTVGLATGTGSGSGTIASTSPVSFTAGAFLLGFNIHDSGASVTAGSGFTLNNDVIGISAAEYADPVSSPTTFPAILSGSVNWAEAGIALNPTLVPPISEYPLGLPLLALLATVAYGVVRRRTRNPASA